MSKHLIKNSMLSLITAAVLYAAPIMIVDGNAPSKGAAFGAEQTKQKSTRKTRKTPALREKIYSKLSQAQKLADEHKIEKSLEILNKLKSHGDHLNSYEKAMVSNFYGFIQYAENNLPAAIAAFKDVVKVKNIPESLELSTLFSIAQINMQLENYDESITYLKRWVVLNGTATPAKTEILFANAYYAKKDYKKAAASVARAVSAVTRKGKFPKENWLILQRAVNYELKDSKKVTSITEDLVRHYSKPQYWVELSNMYGEMGQDKKQIAIMEAAYQQGFVKKSGDLLNLSQLYYYSGSPIKAAEVMQVSMKKGVVEENVRNLQFLAQAFSTAKENNKAIPVLKKAAGLSKDGNIDARLAEIYVNEESWSLAVQSGEEALLKGALKNPANLQMAMGMAYFNQEKYNKSIHHFNTVKELKPGDKVSQQWLSYVQKEQRNHLKLASLDGK